MPQFSEEQELEIKEKMRSILVRMPRASQYQLAEILSIDKDVARRFRNEVQIENAAAIEKQRLDEELAKVENAYEEVITECWRILSKGKKHPETGLVIEPYPTNQEINQALRTIILAKKNLFDIKFDSGLFKRKLGEVDWKGQLGEDEKSLIFKAIDYAIGRNQGKDSDKPEL